MSLLSALNFTIVTPTLLGGIGMRAIRDYRIYDGVMFAERISGVIGVTDDHRPVYLGEVVGRTDAHTHYLEGNGMTLANTYYGRHTFTLPWPFNQFEWADKFSFSVRKFWPTFELTPYGITPRPPPETWWQFLKRGARDTVRYLARNFRIPWWRSTIYPTLRWAAHATYELLSSKRAIACILALLLVIIILKRRSIERRVYNLEGYFDSILMQYLSRVWIIAPQHLRNAFNETPDVPLNKRSNHTHADAAAHRTSGSATLRAICMTAGMRPYSYQRSLSDQRAGTDGSRSWFWTKDLTATPTLNNPGEDHCVMMVDVDHYVDMNEYLAATFRPLLIRTFQPHSVGAVRENYSYTFDKDNMVHFKVSGGGDYNHKVWNWQVDSLYTTVWKWWIWPVTSHYLVDRRTNGPDHEMILLSPVRRFCGLMAVFSWYYLNAKPLGRIEPNQGEFNCMDVRREQTHFVSIGMPGEPNSANISRMEYDAIVNTARVLKNEITTPVVEAQLAEGEVGEKSILKLTAAVITNHVRKNLPIKMPYIFPVEDAIRRYQYGKFEPDAKPILSPYMTPFMHACYAPDATLGNEKRAIESRITSLQQQSAEKEISPFMLRMIEEFSTRLVPDAHSMVPVDIDELYERQPRPSQRSILANAAGMTLAACRRVSSFVKREAYATPNDPRVISTIGPLLKHDYSMFIYAFANEVLKKQEWYAFSRNPCEIADKVTQICQDSETAAVTDFSRYDGHMDATARLLERVVLLRCFKRCYHNELMELHESTFKLRGYGRFGTKYETGYARNSGVPDTSAFNTMFNAFVNYVAQRRVRVTSGFVQADEAWQHLQKRCIFGGDDGLVGNPPATLPSVARDVNHVLEIEIIQRHSFGVTFLARIFGPQVWTGDNSSMCDLSRQLAKFHSSANMPANITPAQKLAEKAFSFWLTDENTPIIGDYVKLVVKHYKPDPSNQALDGIRRWGDDIPKENQWPNPMRAWYLDVCYKDPKLATLAWGTAERYFEAASAKPELLLRPPLIVDIPRELPKATAVVDGERIVVPPPPPLVRQVAVNQGVPSDRRQGPRTAKRAARAKAH